MPQTLTAFKPLAHQAQPIGQFTISHEKRYRRRMRQYEIPQYAGHERISRLLQESVDPKFKSAAHCKLRAERCIQRKLETARPPQPEGSPAPWYSTKPFHPWRTI